MNLKFISSLTFLFCLLFQRGGADRDAYINASESNGFIGTLGSIIVGGIIWWLIISTSNSKSNK